VCFVWNENKQRLFPYTALTDWFLITETECVHCAVRTGSLCVLCGSENKQRLFPYTALTDWFLITETECVYCAVRTGSLCVLCGSENKQRLFPYTALTDWFFNNRDGVCLLRGTNWSFKCNTGYLERLMRNKELMYNNCVKVLFMDIVYPLGLQHFSLSPLEFE
jgi:hypothetical protein